MNLIPRPLELAQMRAQALSQSSFTETKLREMGSRHALSPREVAILDVVDSLDSRMLGAQLEELLRIAVERDWTDAADWLVDRI